MTTFVSSIAMVTYVPTITMITVVLILYCLKATAHNERTQKLPIMP